MQEIRVLLLVEDDDNDVLLTERQVLRATLPVGELLVARSLAEGLGVLHGRGDTTDVVLLDLNLGDSRGLDTLLAVRPAYGGVLIVLTSIDDEMTGVEAIKAGADDYLVKGRLTEERLRDGVAFAQVRHARRESTKNIYDKLDMLSGMVAPDQDGR